MCVRVCVSVCGCWGLCESVCGSGVAAKNDYDFRSYKQLNITVYICNTAEDVDI